LTSLARLLPSKLFRALYKFRMRKLPTLVDR